MRAAERAKDKHKKWALIAAAVVAGLLVLAVAVEAVASTGKVHPGVTVAGVEIGGMSPDKARSVLDSRLPAKAAEAPVVVKYGESEWQVPSSQVALGFDTVATVARAMEVGRSGNTLTSLGQRFNGWFRDIEVDAYPLADEAMVGTTLDAIAAKTDVDPVDAKVVINGTDVAVEDGKDGVGLDRAKAKQLLLGAYLSDKRVVEAPVVGVPKAIDKKDAEAAAGTAGQMLASDASVTFGKKSWAFKPEAIAEWIEFRRSDAAADGSLESTITADPDKVTLIAYIDPEVARKKVLTTFGAGVGKAAVDARFKTQNGKVTIIPSQTGVGPDVDTLCENLTRELADAGSDRTVELRTTKTEPKLTTSKAKEMGVKERLASYTTTYDAGNAPRVNNIHLLGDSLDGTLIAPGGTFSFNETIGERTAEKGYKEANAIVNGKLVPQLGGGICQTATTLFNAVFESGLPVVQRRNHSFYISHYPAGRDATVSWGGPDLKFKNDTDSWVLVSVGYTNSSITIALYGTDPGYQVEEVKGSWTDVRAYPTEEIKDAKLPTGSRVIEDSGVSGRTIVVKRIVKKDGKVIRTDEFKSVYRPKVEIVRVGTKPKPVTTAPTTPTQ